MMEKQDLQFAEQLVSLMLSAHRKGGDGEHLPADRQHDGFFTVEQFKMLKEALGERVIIPDGSNVLQLKPGRYAFANPKDGVDRDDAAGLSYVDVNWFDNKHIQYGQTIAYNGINFQKIIHANGDGKNTSAPNGWGKTLRAYSLWQGGASKVGTTITLADDGFKYKEFRITCVNAGGERVITVRRSNDMAINTTNLADDALGSIQLQVNLTFQNANDGTKLTITKNFSHEDYGSIAAGIDVTEIWEIEGLM